MNPAFRFWFRVACVICFAAPKPEAAWIELHNSNGWGSDETESAVVRKVTDIAGRKMRLNDVAFTPTGDWIVLYGGNGFWTNSLNLPASKKLKELQASPHQFKCVAFAPGGGWAALYDTNGFAAEGIPEDASKALAESAAAGRTLKWIAFAPNGGWCLFYDKNGYIAGRMPDACFKKIGEAAARGATLTSLSFAPGGGWVFFYDDGGFLAAGLPEDAFRKLEELQKSDGPRAIFFAPPPMRFDPEATYVLDVKPSRHIHATLATDITLPNARVANWYLYAPQAPNLPGQWGMTTTFEPGGEVVREESPLNRPVFLLRVTNQPTAVHASLVIDGTLYSRRLRALAPGETAPRVLDLPVEDTKRFTRICPTSDIETKAFHDWIQQNGLLRTANESDLVFAHRAFTFVKHHYTYEWPTENHSASQVYAATNTDCGGLSALFTGVMRANGIPARVLPGRWAKSQTPGVKTGQYGHWHVKAEFFARGVGWVPVDGSSALADPNGENRFFGNDPGDFITFMNDADMVLDSFITGPQEVRLMQGVKYWWHGRGSGKDSAFDDLWTVEEMK